MFNESRVLKNASSLSSSVFGDQFIPPRTQETWILLLIVSVMSTILGVFLFIACGWACFKYTVGQSGRLVFLRNEQLKYLQRIPPSQRELNNMERFTGEFNPAFDKEETFNRTGPSSRLGYKKSSKNENVPRLPSLKDLTPSPPIISEVYNGCNSNWNSMRYQNMVGESINPQDEIINPVYCKDCALERTKKNMMHRNACKSNGLMTIHSSSQVPNIHVNRKSKYENRNCGLEKDFYSDDSNKTFKKFCPRNESINRKQKSCTTSNLHHSCPQRPIKCLPVPSDRIGHKTVSRKLNKNFTCECFYPHRPKTTTENFDYQLPSPFERKDTKQAFELKVRSTNSREKKMTVQRRNSGLLRNIFQEHEPPSRKKRKLRESNMENLDPREAEKETGSDTSADFASALSRSSKMYWKICHQLEDDDEITKEDKKITEEPTDTPSMSWDSLDPNQSPIEENESDILVLNPAAGTGYFSQQRKETRKSEQENE